MPLGSSAGVGAGVDLKDSEEVKDYVENLGIEYRFGCYHEKNPKSCHLLGDYWESIKKDFHKAFKTYETNCLEYNHGHSCHKAGGYRYYGKGCAKDGDISYDLFKKGCEHGYYGSCLSAGLLDSTSKLSSGHIRKADPDPKQALEFFRKGCDEGEIAESCYRYGASFIKGIVNVCSKNVKTAFDYNLKACELGSLAGCMNITIMYRKGEGVEKNENAAIEYAKICEEMMAQLKAQQEKESVKFGVGAE